MYMVRTLVVCLLVALSAGVGAAECQEAPLSEARTYVIVHGAWGGGWAFREVEQLLRAQGHRVLRPTLTGLGERAHLATPEVGLSTHIQDIVNVFLFEELEDVYLVGHSYGGMVVTGVADQVPERIRRLVYLDAFVPEHGESVLTIRGGGQPNQLPGREQDGLIVPPWVQPGTPPPSDVPHPLRSFTEPIVLRSEEARKLPATYILMLAPGAAEGAFSQFADRARARGWAVEEMEGDHNPQWSAPVRLVERLIAVP
jgi:pimeloyl-ACP methyl ester carboxylesterase